MKTPNIKRTTSLSLVLAVGVMATHANILTWDPANTGGSGGAGTWSLTADDWYNGSGDVPWLDNSANGTNGAIFSVAAGAVTLNTSLSSSNLQFLVSGYTLSGSGALTLGAGGIDNSAVSSGTTTIGNNLILAGQQQAWPSASGGTLAINGTVTRNPGATVDFSPTTATPSGVTTTSLANDASGILGGWAVTGDSVSSTTSGNWAANDGSGNIINYTGYTLVGGSTTGAGASAQNWENSAAGTAITLTASATINSVVQQGDFSVANGTTLTLGGGGLMQIGVARWMLDAGGGNLGTAVLTSGLSTGELFIHNVDGAENNWRIWPQINDNGATPVIVVKDGPGVVSLQNTNNYSGGTIINNGVLGTDKQDAYTVAPYCLGSGPVTINGPGILQLGIQAANANNDYQCTNSIIVNGGKILANDGHQHVSGPLSITANGATFGSTYDGGASATTGNKALQIDSLVSGSGPIYLQQAGTAGEATPNGNENGNNSYNSSVVEFGNNANTYSGIISIIPYSTGSAAGSYVAVNASTALQYATLNLVPNTGGHRFAALGGVYSPMVFNTGLGSATLGAITGTGNIILNGFNENTYAVNTDAIALTVGGNNASTTGSGIITGAGSLTKIGTGTLTLSGAGTYTGNTTVSAGTLALSSGGSLTTSSNITVSSGATFDVSALGSITLAANQNLLGSGINNGSIDTSSGSGIYAGTDGGYGTNHFNNNLTLETGAVAHFDLGTANNGANDLITVGGTLTGNNTIIHVKAPSTSASLQAANYVLFTAAGGVSGTFNSAPSWDVQPVNAGNFSIAVVGNTVVLKYAASTAPSGGGTATPANVVRNQTVFISVNATNGSGGTVNSVTVDASQVGGSTTLSLVAAGGNIWTNSVAVTPSTTAGTKALVATITDTLSLQGLVNIPLTVMVGNDVWNGLGNGNFSDNNDWTNQTAPGYIGDSLEFAGTTGLNATMDNNYTITSLLFDVGAGAFNISSGDTLTLSGSGPIINNSANLQTLGMTIADSGGGLTKSGSGAVSLTGSLTYTGPTVVSAGELNIAGSLASTANIAVGNTAGDSVLGISGSANLSPYYLLVGNITNSAAAVYQTGGTVTASAASGYDNLAIGNIAGSFGYYNAAGGSLTVNGLAVAGEDNSGSGSTFGNPAGNGIMDINGATVDDSAGWFVMSRNANATTSILDIYSGSLSFGGGGLVCNWGSGQTSVINVMGGSLTSTDEGIGLGAGSNVGILNLNGGLVSVNSVGGNFGGTSGNLNFNGGTLQAQSSTTAFMSVSAATVYGPGGTIDCAGWNITIAQPFVPDAGNGIHSIAVSTAGAGYIAPPIVTITPGAGDSTGTGATAVAQINPVTGQVTGITITCPGVNYTATPTITFTGGGAITVATATSAAPTPDAIGGMTFEDSLDAQTPITLTGISTYTGSTTIAGDSDLALSGAGSLSSTNIIVGSGAIFDVSGITYTLGNQVLSGLGNVNGNVNTSAGSQIDGGNGVTTGTLTFNNNLTLVSGAACGLSLSTSANGANDAIQVSGTLTASGNSIHLSAPSTSSSLDTSDYTLITAGAISGTFNTAPIWVVVPANAGHYSVVTSGNTVTLHYNATASAPTVTASANPAAVLRNQSTKITAVVTPGSASISSVTLDLTPFGGSLVSLVESNTSDMYTNTITVPAGTTPGSPSLTVNVTDTASQQGSATFALTVNTSTEVWNGNSGSENWSANANWVSGSAPGYVGDSLKFAGTQETAPNMDSNYTVPSLTFSNNAGSFDISSANSSTLTMSGSGAVINNSASPQTLNVTIADAGGGLTKGGSGAVTLAGNNTYTGPTTVSAGTLNLTGTQASTANMIAGSSSSNAVLNISSGISPYYLIAGNASGAAGAVYQTGGTVNATNASGYDDLILGNVPGSYGYYAANGGSLNANGIAIAGEGNNGSSSSFGLAGNGIMEINGGTVIDSGWLVIARNNNSTAGNEVGILNVYGGLLTYAGGGLVGPWDTGESAVINIMGGSVTNTTAVGVYLGDAGYSGILNLNGGLLQGTVVEGYNGQSYAPVAYGQLNFNGGTLRASAANVNFIQVTTADIYSGGGTIDNNGNDITISQPLLAPAGNGVNGISSFTGGAGYIAPPIIIVTNGVGDTTGMGATAIAQINPVTGVVTGVTITCPGVNYTATPIFLVIGGGATTPATITGMVPTANVSGGLTAVGSGITTLTGVSTYTGNTTVSGGTLELSQADLATSSTVSIASGAILQLDFTTTNQVSALVLNGVSQPAGVYNSTTGAPYVTGVGSLLISSTSIASNPTNITFSVTSGNTLNLSWPTDHLGWILQQETNSLSTGLSTNWVDVAGSASVTSETITINRATPTAFYRLRHP